MHTYVRRLHKSDAHRARKETPRAAGRVAHVDVLVVAWQWATCRNAYHWMAQRTILWDANWRQAVGARSSSSLQQHIPTSFRAATPRYAFQPRMTHGGWSTKRAPTVCLSTVAVSYRPSFNTVTLRARLVSCVRGRVCA